MYKDLSKGGWEGGGGGGGDGEHIARVGDFPPLLYVRDI